MSKQKDEISHKDRLTIWLDKNLIKIIKTKAALDGVSVSEIISEMIRKKIDVRDLVGGLTCFQKKIKNK